MGRAPGPKPSPADWWGDGPAIVPTFLLPLTMQYNFGTPDHHPADLAQPTTTTTAQDIKDLLASNPS